MKDDINVSVGILVATDGPRRRVLLSRRRDEAVLGGYWELPGGKIEAGESPQQCLQREFVEELGLLVEVGQALDVVNHHYAHGHVRLHPFICRRLAGTARNLQVAEHRWVELAELGDYRLPPANGPVIEQIKALLAAPLDASAVDAS